jgi:hypothetical protein
LAAANNRPSRGIVDPPTAVGKKFFAGAGEAVIWFADMIGLLIPIIRKEAGLSCHPKH